jgi:hypothetical protein
MGNVQRKVSVSQRTYSKSVFGPSILYLRSTLDSESENISIDYDPISARVRDYSR